jgi:hypothetical protein
MELKQFVKNIINDLIGAVEETNQKSEREINLAKPQDNKTIEFDIAVTVDDSMSSGGKIGIDVLPFINGSGKTSKELRNTSESRIKFGIYISTATKATIKKQREEI